MIKADEEMETSRPLPRIMMITILLHKRSNALLCRRGAARFDNDDDGCRLCIHSNHPRVIIMYIYDSVFEVLKNFKMYVDHYTVVFASWYNTHRHGRENPRMDSGKRYSQQLPKRFTR